uniref:BLOC-1-related complex subunit 5 n=1 Tax=Timema shepardi TaxID=629360 RepID=A0A7R9G4B7_TIMSH|nr:unnamed protein product [Timema shepardi]
MTGSKRLGTTAQGITLVLAVSDDDGDIEPCSLRGLSAGDQPPREQAAGLPVKLSAGADLLHKYQTEWSEIHKQSEENAHQAQSESVVDSVIARLHHTCEKQSLEIVRMSTALANLPQLIDSVQLLMDQIVMKLQMTIAEPKGPAEHSSKNSDLEKNTVGWAKERLFDD